MAIKNDLIFDDEALEEVVRDFVETSPQLLLQHPKTAEFGLKIDRQRLTDQLGKQFTVAVVGQTDAGKSTLINALIGKDLAPTAVTATTATVNHFRYGNGDLCDNFRVHWRDGRIEDKPLKELHKWIGRAKNAEKTRFLDFYANAEFLKTAVITDTPGTRSVLEIHEAAAQGIIADKLEAETFLYGDRAHAVIYVMKSIGLEKDVEALQAFGKARRLPGAPPVNSIAVIQKWDHHLPDPLIEVEKHCERLRKQISNEVCEVLPVFSLLANEARKMSEEDWELLATLGVQSTPEGVRYILRRDGNFSRDRSDTALDCRTRQRLHASIEWAALKFSVWLAHSRALDNGEALRDAVLEVSGIEKLKQTLRTRFFTPQRLIRTSNVLSKASLLCNGASLTLRNLAKVDLPEQRDLGKESRAILLGNGRYAKDTALKPVQTYIETSLSLVEQEIDTVEKLRNRLVEIRDPIEKNAKQLNTEIGYLKSIFELDESVCSNDEKSQLQRLFGSEGSSVAERLGLAADSKASKMKSVSEEMLQQWKEKRFSAFGEFKDICDSAIDRLEDILSYLKEEVNE